MLRFNKTRKYTNGSTTKYTNFMTNDVLTVPFLFYLSHGMYKITKQTFWKGKEGWKSTICGSQIQIKRTFSVTEFYITKFRCSLGDQFYQCPGLFKACFSKKEQEEKERLERIELFHQHASAKNLIKHSTKNMYILQNW